MNREIKGLLIKDLMLLKNQRQFYSIAVIIFIVMLFFYENILFCVAYVTMMFAFFALSTMSYDEHDNGMSYLFSMPITKKAYVREKYILGFILSFVPCVVMSIISFVVSIARNRNENNAEFWISTAAIMLVSFVMLSVQLPLQAKFGVEKSRIVLLVTVGITAAVIYFGANIAGFEEISEAIDNNIKLLPVVLLAVTAVFVCISYNITMRIVEKKEF